MSRDDNVVFVEKAEMPVTAETIGIELSAGYPHHQAAICEAFLKDVGRRSDRSWEEECRRFAHKLPPDFHPILAARLRVLCAFLTEPGTRTETDE